MNFRLRNHLNRLRSTALAIGGICGAATLLAQADGVADQLSSLEDYLARAQVANPQLDAFEQRYKAATQPIPQAAALPDPMLQVTSFMESVQTRNGPQENAPKNSRRRKSRKGIRRNREAVNLTESASASTNDYCWSRNPQPEAAKRRPSPTQSKTSPSQHFLPTYSRL